MAATFKYSSNFTDYESVDLNCVARYLDQAYVLQVNIVSFASFVA